jgi:hypothetical protein
VTSLDHRLAEARIDATELDPEQYEAARTSLDASPEMLKRAFAISVCPPVERGTGYPHWARPCRFSRQCPACAERRGRELVRKTIDLAAAYEHPRALLATLPSASLFDLDLTRDRFRKAFAQLRRRSRWVSAVVGGVAVLEFPLTSNGKRWALHAHGVLGLVSETAADDAWLDWLAEQWAEIVEVPGTIFELEPLKSPRALMRYALKLGRQKSWSPGRELPSARRVHLDRALSGRRLVVEWGKREKTA